jgi:hypothetical protein
LAGWLNETLAKQDLLRMGLRISRHVAPIV